MQRKTSFVRARRFPEIYTHIHALQAGVLTHYPKYVLLKTFIDRTAERDHIRHEISVPLIHRDPFDLGEFRRVVVTCIEAALTRVSIPKKERESDTLPFEALSADPGVWRSVVIVRHVNLLDRTKGLDGDAELLMGFTLGCFEKCFV